MTLFQTFFRGSALSARRFARRRSWSMVTSWLFTDGLIRRCANLRNYIRVLHSLHFFDWILTILSWCWAILWHSGNLRVEFCEGSRTAPLVRPNEGGGPEDTSFYFECGCPWHSSSSDSRTSPHLSAWDFSSQRSTIQSCPYQRWRGWFWGRGGGRLTVQKKWWISQLICIFKTKLLAAFFIRF